MIAMVLLELNDVWLWALDVCFSILVAVLPLLFLSASAFALVRWLDGEERRQAQASSSVT